MIFTFYSYKGGVGRSMALANVAELFYLQGARVLMIDWDLEAPGLESFFYQTEKDLDGVRAKRGLIDLLLHYRQQYAVAAPTESRGPDAVRNAAISTLNLEDWLHPIHPPEPGRSRARGLWLLPAGLRHERFAEYAESVHDFNWAELYADYEGEAFFEWLRAQVAPTFKDHQLVEPGFTDVVLI